MQAQESDNTKLMRVLLVSHLLIVYWNLGLERNSEAKYNLHYYIAK